MSRLSRRNFVKTMGSGAAGLAAVSPWMRTGKAQNSPGNTVRLAVMGIRSRGTGLAKGFASLPDVEVAAICDIDERLFAKTQNAVEEVSGKRPAAEVDVRRLLDDPSIDALVIAAPNHWHALATIWACQSGKDVYVEKPVCHNISEGRRMVEAARKFDRIVQVGTQRRSQTLVQRAMDYLHSGDLGKLHTVRCLIFRPREGLVQQPNSPVPGGVHYDLWVGPAGWRPFNPTRFHYDWHWFWNTGNGETGNNGPHYTDVARWALQKYEHPVRIQSMGSVIDSAQETPNTQLSTLEYADGTQVQIDVRGLYTNEEAGMGMGLTFYTDQGWMKLAGGKWSAYKGREDEVVKELSDDQFSQEEREQTGHFANFVEAVRSRKRHKLNADILEGHYSAAMCHLSNIAYRLGRQVEFNSDSEEFPGDAEANRFLTRRYRFPFVVPDSIS